MGSSDAVCNNFYEEDGSVMNNYYQNNSSQALANDGSNETNNNTEENDLSNWEQDNNRRLQNENSIRTNQEQHHQRYESMQQATHLKPHSERIKNFHHTSASRQQHKHLSVPQWNIPANLSSSYQRLYHDQHYGVVLASPHLQHQSSVTSVPTSLPVHHSEHQTFVHHSQQQQQHSNPNPKRYQQQGLLSSYNFLTSTRV